MAPKKSPFIVHKFGGTSLANSQRFRALKEILSGKEEIIVVSAVQGVTSTLQALLDEAAQKQNFLKTLESLEKTHATLAQELLPKQKYAEIIAILQKDFSEIKDILHAVQ